MNEKELIGRVHSSVYHQCQESGYTTHYLDEKRIVTLKADWMPEGIESDHPTFVKEESIYRLFFFE